MRSVRKRGAPNGAETTTRVADTSTPRNTNARRKRRIKMFQDNLFRELVVDNFAGGGGAVDIRIERQYETSGDV